MLSHRTEAQVLGLGPTTQWHTPQRIFIETGSKMHGSKPLTGCLQGRYGARRGRVMQHAGYELPRIPVLETVWKLRKGFVTGSYKTAERGERAPFPALGVTKRGAIRPAQRLSRQSLEL